MIITSLEDIPSQMADFFSITEATAQVILTVVIVMAILLPALYLSKDRTVTFVALFMGMTICVGLGWLPLWFLIMTICIVAMGIARLGSNVVAGD